MPHIKWGLVNMETRSERTMFFQNVCSRVGLVLFAHCCDVYCCTTKERQHLDYFVVDVRDSSTKSDILRK